MLDVSTASGVSHFHGGRQAWTKAHQMSTPFHTTESVLMKIPVSVGKAIILCKHRIIALQEVNLQFSLCLITNSMNMLGLQSTITEIAI